VLLVGRRGLRDTELHGFAGFVDNAYPNIVFRLVFPAAGALVLSRLPGHWLGRYCLCGPASSITLAWFCYARHGLVDLAAAAARKMAVSAMNCGAKVFMIGFEDSSMPTFDNLVTGQMNLRTALLRETDISTPEAPWLAEPMATAVLATGAQLLVTADPGCWMQVADAARMGERMPVAHTVQVLDASIHGVPTGRLLADTLNGSGKPVLHSTRTAAPAPLMARSAGKEHVHARGLPAGL
jgi:Malate synthase